MSIQMLTEAWEVKELTSTEKLVLAYLAYCHNGKTGLCCPSFTRIKHATGCSRSTVIRAIESLCNKELIEREHRYRADGKFNKNSNRYLLRLRGIVETSPAQVSPTPGVSPMSRGSYHDDTAGSTTVAPSWCHQETLIGNKKGKVEQGSEEELEVDPGKASFAITPAELYSEKEDGEEEKKQDSYIGEKDAVVYFGQISGHGAERARFVLKSIQNFQHNVLKSPYPSHKAITRFWFDLMREFYPQEVKYKQLPKKQYYAMLRLRQTIPDRIISYLGLSVLFWDELKLRLEEIPELHGSLPKIAPTITFLDGHYDLLNENTHELIYGCE